MPRNVEIKARTDDLVALATKAAALAGAAPERIAQDDTFFGNQGGRLKLRAFSATEGELIFYQRADRQGPKESFYVRSATSSPDTLRQTLKLAHGEVGRVIKQRTVFLIGRTRVHLDRVQGLGDFVELEVVLQPHESVEAGVDEAQRLMRQLGIEASQLVEGAYVDLLAQVQPQPSTLQPSIESQADAPANGLPTALQIGRYRSQQQEAVVALWQACGLIRPWNDPRRDIARKLTTQPELFLVATIVQAVVGTAMVGFDGHRGWVYYLAVAPDHRGQAIARSLMQEAERLLIARGCPKLNLQIRSSNEDVVAFYQRLGYVQDDVISLGRRLIADG